MSSIELNDETLFRTNVSSQLKELLAAVAAIKAIYKTPKTETSCEKARSVAEKIKQNHHLLLDKLPYYLQADTEYFKRCFARSIYMWLRFPHASGRAHYDSIGCITHNLFPIDLTLEKSQWPLVDEALVKMGYSQKLLNQIKGGVDAQTSNLKLKGLIGQYICQAIGDHKDRHRIFCAIYGNINLPDNLVDIIVTDAQLFFCLPFDENGLIDKNQYKWEDKHNQSFNDFIESLRLNSPTARVYFPSVGDFHRDKVNETFLAELTHFIRGTCEEYAQITETVVLDTLGTMIMIMASQEIEKFIIHDAWGHAWQETLCDFEWFYEKMGKFKEPIKITEPSIYHLGHAYSFAEAVRRDDKNNVELDLELLDKIIRADIKGRVSVALNACVAELTADITEYKFFSVAQENAIDFPSSSHLDSQAVRLDLTFNDAQKHINSLRQPYIEFVNEPAARNYITKQFIKLRYSEAEIKPIIEDIATHIADNYVNLLADSIPSNEQADSFEASILQKMHLNICSLYCSLDDYIKTGQEIIGEEPDLARYPEASLDFIMIAIACFFEEDRFMNIWHMDEIIDGPLAETIADFGQAWREVLQTKGKP